MTSKAKTKLETGIAVSTLSIGEYLAQRLLDKLALKHDAPSLIECIIDRDDCPKELLQLGSCIAAANSRPSKTQN